MGWDFKCLYTELSNLSPKFPFTVPHSEGLCPFQKLSSPRGFPSLHDKFHRSPAKKKISRGISEG